MNIIAKSYLESYERLYRRSERIAEQIELLESRTTGTQSFRYNHDKVSSSIKSDIFDLVDHKIQLESIFQKLRHEMDDIEAGIREAVSSLPDQDQKIAVMTWIDLEGSYYIAQTLKISRSTVLRRRAEICAAVQAWLDTT